MSDTVIPITKQTPTTPVAVGSVSVETVTLPSKGHFYSDKSPLAKGSIEIYQVTARHEDILSNTNLLKKGTVLDEFLKALIATPNVSLNDLLIGDKNALFVAARKSAYGEIYKAKVKCPSCGAESTVEIDLSKIAHKSIEFTSPKGENRTTFKLPHSGHTLTIAFLTHKDDTDIDQELKALAKLGANATSPEITTRLKYTIRSVDGDTDRLKIKAFVDEKLTARDSLALRNFIRENTPDLDMTFDFSCSECGHSGKMSIPLGVNFFWPSIDES